MQKTTNKLLINGLVVVFSFFFFVVSFVLVFFLVYVFILQPTFPVGPTIGTNTAISFAPYLTPVTPGVGLVPTEILPTPPVIVPGSPPVSVPGSTATQKLLRTDKLEVL